MYKVAFRPSFLRAVKRLEAELQEEVKEKLKLLENRENIQRLRVHKLQGRFSKYRSFSVNYRVRIIFIFEKEDQITLFDIGDHDVYK